MGSDSSLVSPTRASAAATDCTVAWRSCFMRSLALVTSSCCTVAERPTRQRGRRVRCGGCLRSHSACRHTHTYPQPKLLGVLEHGTVRVEAIQRVACGQRLQFVQARLALSLLHGRRHREQVLPGATAQFASVSHHTTATWSSLAQQRRAPCPSAVSCRQQGRKGSGARQPTAGWPGSRRTPCVGLPRRQPPATSRSHAGQTPPPPPESQTGGSAMTAHTNDRGAEAAGQARVATQGWRLRVTGRVQRCDNVQ